MFAAILGVSRCVAGYCGGNAPEPNHRYTKDHTESVLVEFDPNCTSYNAILEEWNQINNPRRTKRRYKSAIYFLNESQETIARKRYGTLKSVYIGPVTKFYPAEEYHQRERVL